MAGRGVVIAFQGEHGAYSEAAARKLFSGLGEAAAGIQYLGMPQFADVFDSVQKGSAMYGMVPVENTLGGSIHANYDLILKCPDLHVVAELDFQVQHCLIGPPSTSRNEIRCVMSHWQALAQCDGYLRAWGVETQVAFDTAGSAKMIKEQGLRNHAAIASELAAETYGLEVLAKGIQDIQYNHTRFLLLSREACAVTTAQQGVKTTVIFWAPHTPGALHRAVAAFFLRNLAICKTESRPVPPQHWRELKGQLTTSGELLETKYHYIFYLDVLAHAESEAMRNALDQVREFSPFVRTIGPYPTGGTLTEDVIFKTKAVMPLPSSTPKTKHEGLRIGIFGFGKFGQYLGKRLADQHRVFVTSILPEEGKRASSLGCTWVDWETATATMLSTLSVDILVISTAMTCFEEVVKKIATDEEVLREARPLVVDVLSVKSYPKEVLLRHLPKECDILCTHPMFGPESGKHGWNGLPFVFEMVRSEQNYGRMGKFLAIFEAAGCRMEAMQCEEHDKLTAASQFITHLTGRLLDELKCSSTPIDTVGYQNLCLIADHVCKDSFDLFYGLFKYNENSKEQLNLLKQGILSVEQQLMERKRQEDRGELQNEEASASSIVFSSTVRRVKESTTCQIFSQAKQLIEEGKQVNKSACLGEPGYPPPPVVITAIEEAAAKGQTRYTVVQGDIDLRKLICADIRKQTGVEYKPENVLVSCGAQQAIYQALLAICEEDDDVVIPTPTWVSYPDMVQLVRASPLLVETTFENDYILQPEALEKALNSSDKIRAIILQNPSNPTGAVIPQNILAGLAEVLRRPEFAHIYVIADEIYSRLVHDTPFVSFASLPGMQRRTIMINGFSKAYAMTGLRLGYMAADHKAVASAALKLQGQITSCASSIVQKAGIAVLREEQAVEEWLSERKRELRANRDLTLSRLRAISGVRCCTPQGAFYVLADISAVLKKGSVKTSEGFCQHLLKEHLVALVPGEAFHAPGTVRISYACSRSELEAALDGFAACVSALGAML